jgi:hypothetical protein
MKLKPTHLFIKFLTPLIWKASSSRKIKAITRFSMIEKDSAVQLLECLRFTSDTKIKADLFQHVLEEFNHADLFETLALSYSKQHLNMAIPSRENVINNETTYEDFLQFYSYVHIGESYVNEDFELYSKAIEDIHLKKTFLRVAMDENRHEVGTDQILVELCANNVFKARRLEFFSKLKRQYKMYTIAMKNIGQVIFNFYMGIIYFVVGPFVMNSARKQFKWSKEKHLQFLSEQIAYLKEKK